MRGNMLRGFGVLFLGFVIASLMSGVVHAALGFAGSSLLTAVGSGLAQAVSGAFTGAIGVILYFDVRCRQESFDLEHLARLVEEPQPA
jgi:hypothetical protein